MIERPEDAPAPQRSQPGGHGESDVWSILSTLIAGPALWGGIGYGGDVLVGSSGRPLTAAGLVLGFVLSFYIVYVRSIRADGTVATDAGARRTPPTSGDAR